MPTALPDTIERETAPNPQWSVIWLHGLGADGTDFVPLIPELIRPGWPALRFVFPHAPVRAVTINNGMRMRAWYDIRDMEFDKRADSEGVAGSVAQVNALIAREGERGVPPARVFLAGFSQGGAITLAAGLERTAPLAGLIGLSTYLPAAQSAAERLASGANTQPVFMGHGTQDPMVPFAVGEHSANLLRQLGFTVDFHHYPMPHSVSADEIRALGDWLQVIMEGRS